MRKSRHRGRARRLNSSGSGSEPDLAQVFRMWITNARSRRIALVWLLSFGVAAGVSPAEERKKRSDEVTAEVQRLLENANSLWLERAKRVLRIAESLRVAVVLPSQLPSGVTS